MTELFLIHGWGMGQWRKALAYYNQCRPEDPVTRPAHLLLDDFERGRADVWITVQKYWKNRRLDEPGDVRIHLLGDDHA